MSKYSVHTYMYMRSRWIRRLSACFIELVLQTYMYSVVCLGKNVRLGGTIIPRGEIHSYMYMYRHQCPGGQLCLGMNQGDNRASYIHVYSNI